MQQKEKRVVLAVCAAALAGCVQQKPTPESFAWTGPVASGAWLRIRNVNGDFDVRQAEGDSAGIRFEIERSSQFAPEARVTVVKVGDDIIACVLYGGRGECGAEAYDGGGSSTYRRIPFLNGSTSARGTILVPRGVRVEVQSTNGDVDVATVGSDVAVTTVNGDVDVHGSRASVKVRTTNGDVAIGAESVDGELQVQTTNGDVELDLPAGLNAALAMTTVNGGLNLDVPATVTSRSPKSILANIGTGGTTIRLQTTNGDISLRPRTP
ncbi:MAG: DUF4097 family beta strand repeat protein [Gemmatimonadaceae bacterium]|nr:DUF4097 family beta strand repeat protein [Gemmatimonadaceae bacterium]